MAQRLSISDEIERRLAELSNMSVRMTLIAVTAPLVPPETLWAIVSAAANRSDAVGTLADGRFAVLALRSAANGNGEEVTERFLARLRTLMATTPWPQRGAAVHVNSAHRLTCELCDADDLLDSVMPTPPAPPAFRQRTLIATLALVATLSLQGCAGIGLTMVGAGAGVGAGTAVDHTLSGIATKTFPAPMAEVRTASLQSLKQMGFQVIADDRTENGIAIRAKAANRDVQMELEQVTARTTRMKVTADQPGLFFRDSSTATEIIVQTAQALDQRPARQVTARR